MHARSSGAPWKFRLNGIVFISFPCRMTGGTVTVGLRLQDRPLGTYSNTEYMHREQR